MRKLILLKLQEISDREKGYPKTTMRWSNFKVDDKHISEVDMDTLTDEGLVIVFEHVIRQSQKSF